MYLSRVLASEALLLMNPLSLLSFHLSRLLSLAHRLLAAAQLCLAISSAEPYAVLALNNSAPIAFPALQPTMNFLGPCFPLLGDITAILWLYIEIIKREQLININSKTRPFRAV